jgi:ABC-type polysaccharide/polyol phosphate export permease
MSMKNSWLFPAIQSIHLAGIALLVGTIVIIDLRILGFGMRRQSISQLVKDLAPLTWAGLIVMWITGPLLFWSDISRYVNNSAFLLKMVLLFLALVHHFTMHRNPRKWNAVLSIALWSCVILAGRAIADFDNVAVLLY